MLRSRFAFVLVLFGTAALAAPAEPELRPGTTLPALRGQFLSGRDAELPAAAHGRIALLLLGFSYESRHPVEAWLARFRPRFDADPRVTFFQVPMLGGAARMGRWFIEGGMRRGTPKADHEHVMTVFGTTEAWKQRLGVSDERAAYLLLLDPAGRVVWLHHGPPDEAAFQALTHAVEQLLARP